MSQERGAVDSGVWFVLLMMLVLAGLFTYAALAQSHWRYIADRDSGMSPRAHLLLCVLSQVDDLSRMWCWDDTRQRWLRVVVSDGSEKGWDTQKQLKGEINAHFNQMQGRIGDDWR